MRFWTNLSGFECDDANSLGNGVEMGRVISMIVPFWGEDCPAPARLRDWEQLPGIREVILSGPAGCEAADGAGVSSDRVRVILADETGRGMQMNAGAQVASGDVLLFHHADSQLTAAHCGALLRLASREDWEWGGFYRKFDDRHPRLRWLECWARWYSRNWGAIFGDQSLFVRRMAFERVGGFAAIPLMEDVEFSRRMWRVGRPVLLDPPMESSPRRHLENGAWRTTWRNLSMLMRYRCGASPHRLHAEYYPGAALSSVADADRASPIPLE